MAKKNSRSVTIDGVKYNSATAAAVALVKAGKSISEAAKATGITYQTVYANTKGKKKRIDDAARRRVLAHGQKGNLSDDEITDNVYAHGQKGNLSDDEITDNVYFPIIGENVGMSIGRTVAFLGQEGYSNNRAKKAETAAMEAAKASAIAAAENESAKRGPINDNDTAYLNKVLDAPVDIFTKLV